ncbi:MAG: dihydropyrimidinase [Candidatus Binatia bacterium]
MDVILRNGTVVTANDVYEADVGIEGGVVKQIGKNIPGPAKREVDCTGKLLVPGGVDVHTHCETVLLGEETADDWYSSSAQAACGGITTVVDYALTHPDQSIIECLQQWEARAKPKTIIDYGLHPTLMKPSDKIIAEMPDVVAEGHTSFKIFMTGLAGFDEYSTQYAKAMAQAGKLGALINIHCEDQTCISFHTQQLEAAGHSDIRHYPDSRPRESEGIAAQRAIQLARMTDTPIYMVHLSCQESLDEINEARARGQSVYGETRPIYLHLSRDRFEEKIDPERYVGWPPLRHADQMEVLWQALDHSVLQTVATDHVGWTMKQKKKYQKVDELIPGMANLETVMPMLYSEGVRKNRLSLQRFVAVSSANPAKLMGLYPRKGTIAVGSDADIAVFDPNKKVTIHHKDLHSKQGWELHEGFEVTGWPVMTLSRGEIIVENGKVLGQPGRGQLLKRKRFADIKNIIDVR